jgi:peptide deformylase
MSLRKVSQIGDPVIRAIAKSIKSVASVRTKKVIADLVETMREKNLVGMAAPQIGVGLRVFVTEVRKTKFRKSIRDTDPLRVFINPRIIRRSEKKTTMLEGCGSVAAAELFGPVERSVAVTIIAHDENNRKFKLEAKGFLARVIQHEYDHLDGTVILDRFKNTRQVLDKKTYIKGS